MVDGMITAIRNTDLKINAMLVPGDLTSTGEPSEFIECMELLVKIAETLVIPKERIFITYGNHDVNWNISKLADGNSEKAGDTYYKHVAARLGPTLLNSPTLTNIGPIPGSGQHIDDKYELTILNSGHDCCHDQQIKNGNLGQEQLNWIRKLPIGAKDKFKILMIHHHPMNLPYPVVIKDLSTLAEGPELLKEINRLEIDFVIHGHRHHPMLHTDMIHGCPKPVSFLCAGSVGAGSMDRNDGDIPNSFHIISFAERTSRGSISGKVLTYCYRGGSGWTKTAYSLQNPIDPESYFGACNTELEAKQDLELFIQNNSNLKLIKFPDLGALPLSVRCLTIEKINLMIQDVLESCELRMSGQYPGAVHGFKI